MNSDSYDLIVIGGGPAGYAAALYGAAGGLSVAIVENNKVGGTCLHRGCIPAKELLETAGIYRSVGRAEEFGIQAFSEGIDFSVAQQRKDKVVDQLYKGLSGIIRSRGITTIAGTAQLVGQGKVSIDKERIISGKDVILATGSVPRTVPGFEVDKNIVVTSDELLDIQQLPASMMVIGGGAIGCEFASMMADFGVKVTLVEVMEQLLPGCDAEVSNIVTRSFKRRGIDVLLGTAVVGHTPLDATAIPGNGIKKVVPKENSPVGTTVKLNDGNEIQVEKVLVCVGRRPFSDFGLGEDMGKGIGVEVDKKGFVTVDDFMRTTVSNVWAAGDIVNSPQLAHVGFAEAIVIVKSILGESVIPVDYSKVPWCIYSHPEVAFCGMTETAAVQAGYDVVVQKDPFAANSRARIIGETDGLVKIIAERNADGSAGKLLGVHMVGPWVTEQLGQAYLALNWEASPDEIAQFIQPHPTLSESFGESMLRLSGRGLHLG